MAHMLNEQITSHIEHTTTISGIDFTYVSWGFGHPDMAAAALHLAKQPNHRDVKLIKQRCTWRGQNGKRKCETIAELAVVTA